MDGVWLNCMAVVCANASQLVRHLPDCMAHVSVSILMLYPACVAVVKVADAAAGHARPPHMPPVTGSSPRSQFVSCMVNVKLIAAGQISAKKPGAQVLDAISQQLGPKGQLNVLCVQMLVNRGGPPGQSGMMACAGS